MTLRKIVDHQGNQKKKKGEKKISKERRKESNRLHAMHTSDAFTDDTFTLG